MTLRCLLALALAAAVAACSSTQPSASEPATSASARSEAPSASPTAPESPEPTGRPGLDLPEAGRPYDAAAILDAMRESRRPGGVPDQLETEAIASAVAAEIWTFDGEPWTSVAAGGSCGPQICTLEVAGAPLDAVGEDVYIFTVTPSDGAVDPLDVNLRGLPVALLEALDDEARAVAQVDLAGMGLASARWLPPPERGQFVLAYRSGGEEGAPGFDLLLDVERGTATVR